LDRPERDVEAGGLAFQEANSSRRRLLLREAIEEFGLEAIARRFQGRPSVTGIELSPGTWDSRNW